MGDARDRRSTATAVAAGELMLGETVLGGRLRDLRTLLAYLRSRTDLDGRRVALWGESFAFANGDETEFKVAYTAAKRPLLSEPLGGLLALLGGLFEDEVRVILACGCVADYQSLLDSPFTYAPFDAIVPGALSIGDLPGLASGLPPRPLRMEEVVTGHNRLLKADQLIRTYDPAFAAYKDAGQTSRPATGTSIGPKTRRVACCRTARLSQGR